VDDVGRQPWDGMDQLVLGVVGNRMAIRQRRSRVDVEFGVDVDPVPDPAHSHPTYVDDIGDRPQRLLG
jgi:hypothetical protein